MIKFREKETGRIYDVESQMLDLNFNGKYVLRYNIGIKNYQGFHNVRCIYDNETFNNEFEAVTYLKEKQEWVLYK